MHKKESIVVAVLVLVFLGAVFGLILISKPLDKSRNTSISNTNYQPRQAANNDSDESKKTDIMTEEKIVNYRQNVRQIFAQYSDVWQSGFNMNATSSHTSTSTLSNKKEKINNIKSNLLALRVPVEYRDLHLEFALIISQSVAYFESGDKNTSRELTQKISELKESYPWINPDS